LDEHWTLENALEHVGVLVLDAGVIQQRDLANVLMSRGDVESWHHHIREDDHRPIDQPRDDVINHPSHQFQEQSRELKSRVTWAGSLRLC
jgi:hypothetical protein